LTFAALRCFGGGGGTDNSALQYQKAQDAQARADEEARQARIATGRQQIDALFDRGETLHPGSGVAVAAHPDYSPEGVAKAQNIYAQTGQFAPVTVPASTTPAVWDKTGPAFDDSFYNQRKQAYIDNYTPQLTDQFAKARNDMSFALARAGLTRSSAAADQVARLNAADAVQSATVANQAEGQVSALRSKVEDNRANLVTQLQSSADPGGTANLALSRTQSLAAEPLTYSPLGDVFAGLSSGIGNFVQGARQASILQRYGIPGIASATASGTGSGQGTSIKPS
jgi:hypothetical protein